MKKWSFLFLLSSCLLFIRCDCANMASSLLVSPNDEYQIGESFHKNLKYGYRDSSTGQTVPPTTFFLNPKLGRDSTGLNVDASSDAQMVAAYVDSLGRIIAGNISDDDWATLLPSAYPQVNRNNFFQFRVIRDSTVNAFSVAGAKVYFYAGILKNLNNQAELIGVISHEMGHVILHHTRKRLLTQMAASTLLSIISDGQPGILSNLGLNWFLSNHGQEDELEADSMGVILSYQIGANPNGIRTFFSRELVFDSSTVPPHCIDSTSFLGEIFQSMSTHPANCARVNHAQNLESSLADYANAENRPTNAPDFVQHVKVIPGWTMRAQTNDADFQNRFLKPLQRLTGK